ncbi:uncharacterized protein PHALS_04193 [Plasmopara halstedii]|uniref:Uncharacterized protein n=1 Tax=Plasmopara halstedii TaxID=4781 RepID=A0A0P1A989_PLAHL|nr:uncharacterized protein PHALS_04193 [Plasmopara halstedii]CEG36943.1 hypothetical protein PHALS_04193 [Plasmopara halstedii]|eukprot:XP_024573312.1 hypothetical protein PHALS_04193 [Plasmopara halstedii]
MRGLMAEELTQESRHDRVYAALALISRQNWLAESSLKHQYRASRRREFEYEVTYHQREEKYIRTRVEVRRYLVRA